MNRTKLRICTFCEATCGLEVVVGRDSSFEVRGDRLDPFSRGYLCRKAHAVGAVHRDPDRLRTPVRREGGGWVKLSWDEALEEITDRLATIRARNPDAVAFYLGNPTVFDYATVFYARLMFLGLGTANRYSTSSLDGLPHQVCSYLMFGHQFLVPVPDLDRTQFFLVIGANPVVSNGSIMTAPGVRRRLAAIQRRGGEIVVIDPRRTETAAVADQHIFIRPGTDPVLLLAMLHVILRERLTRASRLLPEADREGLRHLASQTDETVAAAVTGVPADTVRDLARRFARAPRAVCYGRIGVAHQAFSVLTCWLINVLNLVTGNLDRPGGAMFTRPAVDLVTLTRLTGNGGGFGPPTRVLGLPSFAGERPVATLADEISTPGPGQVKGLITVGANPVLCGPNGRRLDRALADLDLFVAIDPYITATTRHATYILPPASMLTRDQYPLITSLVSVRNIAKYTEPALEAGPDERADWQILCALYRGLARRRPGLAGLAHQGLGALADWLGPSRILDAALRLGPYGILRSPGRRLSLSRLRREPHGVDLGPLLPMLRRRFTRVRAIPEAIPAEVARLLSTLEAPRQDGVGGELLLIGRRQRGSSNSWLHNVPGMASAPPGCTLLMHPDDARARHIQDRDMVLVRSRTGSVSAPVAVTDEVMPGVVSLPHGWGHDLPGVRLSHAARDPGASINALTDDRSVDGLSGTAHLSGALVTVEVAPPDSRRGCATSPSSS